MAEKEGPPKEITLPELSKRTGLPIEEDKRRLLPVPQWKGSEVPRLVRVTSEIAEAWLKNTEDFRRRQIHRSGVLRWVRSIQRGDFEPEKNTDGVLQFSDEGWLQNGQHRLSAIVITGKPYIFRVRVVRHDSASMRMIDLGQSSANVNDVLAEVTNDPMEKKVIRAFLGGIHPIKDVVVLARDACIKAAKHYLKVIELVIAQLNNAPTDGRKADRKLMREPVMAAFVRAWVHYVEHPAKLRRLQRLIRVYMTGKSKGEEDDFDDSVRQFQRDVLVWDDLYKAMQRRAKNSVDSKMVALYKRTEKLINAYVEEEPYERMRLKRESEFFPIPEDGVIVATDHGVEVIREGVRGAKQSA